MKRQWKLALCLLLAAVTLSACAGGGNEPPQFAEVTQNLGPNLTNTPAPQAGEPDLQDSGDPSIFSNNPYDVPDEGGGFTPEDALGEEGYVDPYGEGAGYSDNAESTYYPYAGSTPIPLDPVDMPSPTPRPELSFTYGAYTASIGVSFEAPVGWLTDESQSELFTLSEPVEQIKEGQQCVVTISAVPVANNYSESNLKTEVTQRLDALGATNFIEWKPSLTATRYLMGSKGVYANYTGKLANGTEIGGRIHYVCIDKVLYSLEIVYPLGYKDSYLNVFSQIRETMKRT